KDGEGAGKMSNRRNIARKTCGRIEQDERRNDAGCMARLLPGIEDDEGAEEDPAPRAGQPGKKTEYGSSGQRNHVWRRVYRLLREKSRMPQQACGGEPKQDADQRLVVDCGQVNAAPDERSRRGRSSK